jgi:hypothetical protein
MSMGELITMTPMALGALFALVPRPRQTSPSN